MLVHVHNSKHGSETPCLALALGAQPAVEGDADDGDEDEDDGRDGETDVEEEPVVV